MKIKCIIIDDEPLAINVIKNFVHQVNDLDLTCTFNNAIDGLDYLKDTDVDLIFLDINMPLLDGLSFIKSLTKKPLIIITSAHENYAAESFDLNLLDYLVKPISFPRFMKAINKVYRVLIPEKKQVVNTSERTYIFIKLDKKTMKKIFLDELLVVESLKDYLKIITLDKKYIIHHTLTNFTELLPSNKFMRIHRSYTVALDKIDLLEGNSVEIGGIRYVISRTYLDSVKNRILNG